MSNKKWVPILCFNDMAKKIWTAIWWIAQLGKHPCKDYLQRDKKSEKKVEPILWIYKRLEVKDNARTCDGDKEPKKHTQYKGTRTYPFERGYGESRTN